MPPRWIRGKSKVLHISQSSARYNFPATIVTWQHFVTYSLYEAGSFQDRREQYRAICIRSLAFSHVSLESGTSENAVDDFLSHPETLHFFDNLAALGEVVFLRCSGVNLSDNYDTTNHPGNDKMLKSWEETMRKIKYLKAMSGYTKWADLRVDVALFNFSKKVGQWFIRDEQEGFPMFGPSNELKF